MNLRAADFFTVENFAPAPSSLQRPSVIAEHTGHGCCPSKVDETASATEAVSDRATSIPVHAVPCNNTQCAPLKYSAQLRMINLCRKDFILTLSRGVM